MKRLLPIAVLLLGACGDSNDKAWSGYAEAEYVYVAAPLAGTLTKLNVAAGQSVQKGKPLFELESEAERAAQEEAKAKLASAHYTAENTDKSRRAPEIAMQQAQLEQARAQASLAQRELTRKRELEQQGFVARAQVDEARTALEQANARVQELVAAVQVAKLPVARPDERAAADAQEEAARQQLRQTEWRTQQKQQAAPADGVVSDTFFRPGEFVNAGQPVLALLPPGQVKARFYVPETELAKLAPGKTVRLSCDSCGAAIEARVSFIATQPEYTPPVIYSNSQRSKLVFLVEARPTGDASKLRPGLPLDVRLAEAPK